MKKSLLLFLFMTIMSSTLFASSKIDKKSNFKISNVQMKISTLKEKKSKHVFLPDVIYFYINTSCPDGSTITTNIVYVIYDNETHDVLGVGNIPTGANCEEFLPL